MKTRINYDEVSSIMNAGVVYSLIHNCGAECEHPAQRRELLLRKFLEKQTLVNSGDFGFTDIFFFNTWLIYLEVRS